jgi:hypothetical protein
MPLPLPEYKSLGSQIVNQLNKLSQNQLLNEQVHGAQIDNEFSPQFNQMKLQQGKEQSARQNQLFPEELKKLQNANQLSKMKLDQYLPKSQSDIAYKNALTGKMDFQQKNPLYGQPGVAGQIGAAQISDPRISQMIMNSLNNKQQQIQSNADLNSKRSEGYTFNTLPMPNRQYLLAQAAGMGIEPNEASARFNKGETIDQMAKKEGFDYNNKPEPVYPLTPAGQTQLKMRQAANSEIQILGKKISDAMAPYSRNIMGYSPVQVSEALKGKNPDSQAKLLAARALQPELASIRLRMGGGNVGIEAIREMTHSSMGKINNLQELVSPDVYSKTNEYVDKWLTEAVEAANKKATEGVAKKENKSSNDENDPLGIR